MLKPLKYQGAMCLSEVLVALLLVAVISSFSIPAWNNWMGKQNHEQAVERLKLLLKQARAKAVKTHSSITVCPSNNSKDCQQNWSDGVISFIDLNGNRKRDSHEQILNFQKHIAQQLTLRAFPSSKSLQFNPLGLLNNSNGRFNLCESHYQTTLSLSKSGRIKLSQEQPPC